MLLGIKIKLTPCSVKCTCVRMYFKQNAQLSLLLFVTAQLTCLNESPSQSVVLERNACTTQRYAYDHQVPRCSYVGLRKYACQHKVLYQKLWVYMITRFPGVHMWVYINTHVNTALKSLYIKCKSQVGNKPT